MLRIEDWFQAMDKETDIENFPELKAVSEQVYNQINRDIIGFELPIKIQNGDEFDSLLKNLLMNYAKNIQKSGFSDYPNLQKDVKEICQNIIDALQHERKGNSTTAERHIMKAIKICGEHPLAISIIDRSYAFRGSSILNDLKSNNFNYTEQANYPLSFFRCRSLEGATHSLTSFRDMLHIPLNKRSLCSEQRFSISGVSCLYLGATSYVCWKELGEPTEYYLSAYRLKDNNKLKILNLVIPQRLLNGLTWNPYDQISQSGQIALKIFPLVLSTAFHVTNHHNEKSHSEYTISNLIMRCLPQIGVDGVAYISSHNKSEFDYPHGVNLALPIFEADTPSHYGHICDHLLITNPIHIDMNNIIDQSQIFKDESYINHIYNHSPQPMCDVAYKGETINYCQTPFSYYDNFAFSQEFYETNIDTV